MNTHFFLARHGETQWNKIKKLQGQLDSPLTDTGIAQAKQLAHSFDKQPIALIVASPLNRSLTTAEICQKILKCPLQQHPLLIERHFGDWQGQRFDDVQNERHFREIFFQVSNHQPPNGESAIASASRFKQALVEVAQANAQTQTQTQKNILVITHGDILRSFLSYIDNNKEIDDPSNPYNNGSVIAITFNHQQNKFSFNLQFNQLQFNQRQQKPKYN